MQLIAFIHGHKEVSWHSGDMAESLGALKWGKYGYVDLHRRCAPHTLCHLQDCRHDASSKSAWPPAAKDMCIFGPAPQRHCHCFQ